MKFRNGLDSLLRPEDSVLVLIDHQPYQLASAFAQAIGRERRHSIGARFHGQDRGWDWNWEAIYQFG